MNEKKPLTSLNDLSWTEAFQEHLSQSKSKKFFRIALPILIIEILLIAGFGIYLILLPKNYCDVSVNRNDAIVYINDKETNTFRFDNPGENLLYYYYEVDIDILLPAGKTYNVSFSVDCDKYSVYLSTPAKHENGGYALQVIGGVKTNLLSSLTFRSESIIKDFNVKVDINVA